MGERNLYKGFGISYFMTIDRLFVNLTSECFGDFLIGKRWEVRKYDGHFNEKTVVPGRRVEFREAYNRASVWNIVLDSVIIGSLEEIFDKVPYQKIEPRAKSKEGAIEMNKKLLGDSEKYIAFETDIN